MAVRIQLGGAELARVRFAVSPVYETVMALAALRRPGIHAVHLPWARWARPRLAGIAADLDPLLALLSDDRVKPAFLMPAPDSRLPGIDEELRRVRRTPTDRVRADLELLGGAVRGAPALREVHADPRRALARLVAALRACYDAIVAPHWRRMVRLLDADVVHRAAVLAAGGAERLFADLHEEVVWAEGELVVFPRRLPDRPRTVTLGGHGLVLCPSVFCWPLVTVGIKPVAAGTLRYPARGVATLWETPAPVPDALSRLIGRTRAALLVALAQPATTADLAARLAVTAGAVSQHLGVLRDAGLVNTHRDGRAVLHLRTPAADALTAGHDSA